MAKTTKAKSRVTKASPKDRNNLEVSLKPGEAQEAAMARTVLAPTVRAAVALREYSKEFADIGIVALTDELTQQVRKVNDGQLNRAESMLIAQAHTLDAVFSSLARRAAANMGEYIGAAETYLRLALKAQSQCRATLETLAAIKNPTSVAFVRQANIGHAVQVNNGPAHARAGKQSPQDELSEGVTHEQGQRLDLGTPTGASAAHPSMATVGEIHRPEGGTRQGGIGPQRMERRPAASASRTRSPA